MLQNKASASRWEKENKPEGMDPVHRAVLYEALHNHGGRAAAPPRQSRQLTSDSTDRQEELQVICIAGGNDALRKL